MKKFLAIAFTVMMVMSISGAASAYSEPNCGGGGGGWGGGGKKPLAECTPY